MFIVVCSFFVFVKQKTAYELRISDWSSDVCSSDLGQGPRRRLRRDPPQPHPPLRADGRQLGGVAGARRRRRLRWRRVRDADLRGALGDRKSGVWGKSVSVRVDLGGRRIIKKKTQAHSRRHRLKYIK